MHKKKSKFWELCDKKKKKPIPSNCLNSFCIIKSELSWFMKTSCLLEVDIQANTVSIHTVNLGE